MHHQFIQKREISWRIALYLTVDKDKRYDVERLYWSRIFSNPMKENVPEGFPAFTLGAQRTLCTVSLLFPSKLVPCLDALYQACWIDGIIKIGEPEVFMRSRDVMFN